METVRSSSEEDLEKIELDKLNGNDRYPVEFPNDHNTAGDEKEEEVEPDSLADDVTPTPLDEVSEDSEVEQVFIQSLTLRDRPKLVPNRSSDSISSHRSVSYFVDLKDTEITSAQDDRGASERLTQSMYARSESRESQTSVSFFIDVSAGTQQRNESTGSTAGGTRRQRTAVDNPPKPFLCGSDQANAFFQKIMEALDLLAGDSQSRDEVRYKRRVGENIERLLKWQEERLRSRKSFASASKVCAFLYGTSQNRCSILDSSPEETTSAITDKKPSLRRERTFDLDPGESIKEVKVVKISLDGDETSAPVRKPILTKDDERLLEMFKRQRIFHLDRLSKEMHKLDKIERELALKTSSCGPEPKRCWELEPISAPAVEPQASSSPCETTTPVTAIPHLKPDLRPRPVPRPRTRLPMPQRPARKRDFISPDDGTQRVRDSRVPASRMLAMTRSCYEGNGVAAGGSGALMMTQSFHEGLMTKDQLVVKSKVTAEVTGKKRQEAGLVTLADTARTTNKVQSNKFKLTQRRNEDENHRALDRQSSGSACSWFIPNDDEPEEPKADVGMAPDSSNQKSLYQQYQARKKKSSRSSEAFYISYESEEGIRSKRKPITCGVTAPRIKANVVDLQKDESQKQAEINLQEALRRRHPAYIARTKSRESQRVARKTTLAEKGTVVVVENIPGLREKPRPAIRASVNHSKVMTRTTHQSETKRLLRHEDKCKTTPSSVMKKPYESPYSQSLMATSNKKVTGGAPKGVPNVLLSSREVKKRKEKGGYRTNRTMTTLAQKTIE